MGFEMAFFFSRVLGELEEAYVCMVLNDREWFLVLESGVRGGDSICTPHCGVVAQARF